MSIPWHSSRKLELLFGLGLRTSVVTSHLRLAPENLSYEIQDGGRKGKEGPG